MRLSKREMTQTHTSRPPSRSEPVEREALEAIYRDLPIWGPILVAATAIALDVVLPNKLRLGPRWLAPGLEALLVIALALAAPQRRARHYKRRRSVVLILIALLSVTNAVSLALLCHYLVAGAHESGKRTRQRRYRMRGNRTPHHPRMFTARATTNPTVIRATSDWPAISDLAMGVSGIVSVGLNAVALVNDRYR